MRYVWIGLAALLGIVLIVNFWYLVLILVAVAAIVVAVMALANGSAYRVKSRRAGALMLVAGVITFSVGAAGTVAATSGPADRVAQASSARSTAADGDASAARSSAVPKPKPTPTVVREVKLVEERQVIPYASSNVDDGSLPVGTSAVHIPGANGERVVRYEVRFENGVEVSRTQVSDTVSVQPVDEVIAQGTYVAPPPVPEPEPAPASGGCHPSYEGECVGFASDADCAGGSGNGPIYVTGPVRVVGPDVYDLDRDGDGIACDA